MRTPLRHNLIMADVSLRQCSIRTVNRIEGFPIDQNASTQRVPISKSLSLSLLFLSHPTIDVLQIAISRASFPTETPSTVELCARSTCVSPFPAKNPRTALSPSAEPPHVLSSSIPAGFGHNKSATSSLASRSPDSRGSVRTESPEGSKGAGIRRIWAMERGERSPRGRGTPPCTQNRTSSITAASGRWSKTWLVRSHSYERDRGNVETVR